MVPGMYRAMIEQMDSVMVQLLRIRNSWMAMMGKKL